MSTIRSETAGDRRAVREVNERAFDRPNEAALVEAVCAAADPIVSLVAVDNEQVVGHILFSPLSIEDDHSGSLAMGLGPMAVLPNYQRQGKAIANFQLSIFDWILPKDQLAIGNRQCLRSLTSNFYLQLKPGINAGRTEFQRASPCFVRDADKKIGAL